MAPKSSADAPNPPPASPASPHPRLTLIGTVHGDASAFGRLLALLERLAPTALTLEMSPYSLAWRQERSSRLLRLLEERLDELRRESSAVETAGGRRVIESIRTLLALPYEYRAAADYAEREGLSLRLIDLSAVAKRKLARVEDELLTPANLRVLIELPEEEKSGDESYVVAARFLNDRFRPEARRVYLERRRGGKRSDLGTAGWPARSAASWQR